MTALSVYADPAARGAGNVDEVMASLPLSPTRGVPGADIVVVAGGEGWPGQAVSAIDRGARAVLVVRPVGADTGELARAAQQRSAVVVLDAPWAGNPVVPSARASFQDAARGGGDLEVRIVVPVADDLPLSLVDGLQLVRAVLGEITDLRVLTWTGHGLHAEGRVGAVVAGLAVIRSDAAEAHASVRLVNGDRSVDLQLPDWRSARPAQLTTTTSGGATSAPTLFESAHRATWRRLLHHVGTDTPSDDLTRWQADSTAAARASPFR